MHTKTSPNQAEDSAQASTESPPGALAKLIQDRRIELDLSKAAAASKAGIDRGTWHDIETGARTNMLSTTLSRIDVALDWEPGHLRRLTRPLETDPDDDAQLRRKFISFAGTLSIDRIRYVLEVIESYDGDAEHVHVSLDRETVRAIATEAFAERFAEMLTEHRDIIVALDSEPSQRPRGRKTRSS